MRLQPRRMILRLIVELDLPILEKQTQLRHALAFKARDWMLQTPQYSTTSCQRQRYLQSAN